MSKKKTSFKELLSKGASNPRINVQNVRDQRQRLDTLKRSAQPAASAQQPPAKRVASSSDAPALAAQKTSVAAGGQPAFLYAPTFAGLRPGYAFKNGPKGTGYYLEDKAAAAAAAAAEAEIDEPAVDPSVEAARNEMHVSSSGVFWCAVYETPGQKGSSGYFWYLLPDAEEGVTMSYRKGDGSWSNYNGGSRRIGNWMRSCLALICTCSISRMALIDGRFL